MTCVKAWYEPFELSLQRPLQIKGQSLTVRRGAWLYVEDEAGHVGQGEIAPLPGVSGESLEQALDQLRGVADEGNSVDLCLDRITSGTLAPSVRCGVDMALQILAWSSAGTPKTLEGRSVRLNGLAMGDEAELVDHVTLLLDEGYSCIKVKVGRCPLEQDIRRIQRVQEMIAGRAMLRLDANQAWSLDQATRFAKEVGSDRVEYIEEPVAGRDEQVEFHRRTGMALALDESLGPSALPAHLELTGVAALILKPALLGSLARVQAFMDLAATQDIKAILSSTFESAVALRFYASLAALMNMSDQPHGLDTWRWLPGEHVADWLAIERGRICL